MGDRAFLVATVYGRVQGVYFRAFVYDYALTKGLVGYARNLSGGRRVEVKAEGETEVLKQLLALLREGPPSARVEKVEAEWGRATGRFDSFEVR